MRAVNVTLGDGQTWALALIVASIAFEIWFEHVRGAPQRAVEIDLAECVFVCGDRGVAGYTPYACNCVVKP